MQLMFVTALICFLATTSAGIIGHAGDLEHSPAQYEFHYSVHDMHTGDVKDQFEHRRGDYVTGRYSLIEPDGQRRIVDYSSDPVLGFTAQVRREFPIAPGAQPKAAVIEEWPAPPMH